MTTTWPDIDSTQLLRFKIRPDAGLVVALTGGMSYLGGYWRAVFNQTADLASHVPASGSRFVLMYLDAGGLLKVRDGIVVAARSALIDRYIPPLGAGEQALAAVILDAGASVLSPLHDILDLRGAPIASAHLHDHALLYQPLNGFLDWSHLQNLPAELLKRTVMFTVSGKLTISTNPLQIVSHSPIARRITGIYLDLGSAPVGGDVVVDVQDDGYSLFSDTGAYPTVADGETHGFSTTIDNPEWWEDEALSLLITGIGATQPGENLVVQIEYQIGNEPY